METVWYLLGWVRIAIWVLGLSYAIHGVVKPAPEEHLRLWDRLIRAIGVVIILTILVAGFVWGGWMKWK
jgi:hypothetical protein